MAAMDGNSGLQGMKPGVCFVLAITVLSLGACIPDPVIAVFEPGDLRPPAVVSWGATGPAELKVVFDEAVQSDPGAFDVAMRSTGQEGAVAPVPGDAAGWLVSIVSVMQGPASEDILVLLDRDQKPGLAYVLTGLVRDRAGNLSSFVLPYWGFNPNPARLVINELLTEGTSTRPDALELYVHQGGRSEERRVG